MSRITWTDLTPVTSMPLLGDTLPQQSVTLTSRELLSLAVVALDAADKARKEKNFEAERYYCMLARKCDRLATGEKEAPSCEISV